MIYTYIDDTKQFRIDVENSGETDLEEIKVILSTSNATIRIIPPSYSFMNTTEKRIFLVSVTPGFELNETLSFNISTTRVWKQIDIPMIVWPGTPPFNVTEIIFEKDRLKALVNDTTYILNTLADNEYDVVELIETIDEVYGEIVYSEEQIAEGKYEDAESLLGEIREDIEAVLIAMEDLVRLPPTIWMGGWEWLFISVIIITSVIFIYLFVFYMRSH
jgi:hypothetical protein